MRSFDVQLVGGKHLKMVFAELPKGVQKRVNVKVVRAMSTPALKRLRKEVPVDYGFMKKAVGRKIKRMRNETGAYAVMGGKNDLVWTTTTKSGAVRRHRPSKYWHLALLGTKLHPVKQPKMNRVIWVKARPNDFVPRAYRATKSQAIAIAADKLTVETRMEAYRLRRKG